MTNRKLDKTLQLGCGGDNKRKRTGKKHLSISITDSKGVCLSAIVLDKQQKTENKSSKITEVAKNLINRTKISVEPNIQKNIATTQPFTESSDDHTAERGSKIGELSQRKTNFSKGIFVGGDMQNAIAASSTVETIEDGFEDTVSESEASASDCSSTTECANGSRVPLSDVLSDLIIEVQNIFSITDCLTDLRNEFTMVTKEVLRIK
mmetsp:Transcript_19990/g.28445  ORF Transcript_19990/g.28445 Transcript_19990/m.28445 type:complete len:207 (-) Transcript_19990:66-686(-)|eukprot:CAMPEP_0172423548 /NCGR_PEP_ID=MMETSP1064-20121228/17388_1 /TAXON_ID=202472 /ORGANISM="Aulacoseira subarctica , Strain CCAP 1002/5" /LENGTH=206 /DNA_ID=CAMNT_0013164973 /DNA_START=102 /DNA_END=722 /DNA_ORIENTATION=+